MDIDFSDMFLTFRWKEWRDKVAAELRQSVSSTFFLNYSEDEHFGKSMLGP